MLRSRIKITDGPEFLPASWSEGLLIRETGLIEHVCKHGVGHPDPRSSAWHDEKRNHKSGTWSVHGCDGCCSGGYDNTGEVS